MSTELEVGAVVLAPIDSDRLRGRFLDRPRAGERPGRLAVVGWVAPGGPGVEAIEVVRDGARVAAAAPRTTGLDGRVSFSLELEGSVLHKPASLLVRAVFDDGVRVAFGEVRLRPVQAPVGPATARSGIVARLLGALGR